MKGFIAIIFLATSTCNYSVNWLKCCCCLFFLKRESQKNRFLSEVLQNNVRQEITTAMVDSVSSPIELIVFPQNLHISLDDEYNKIESFHENSLPLPARSIALTVCNRSKNRENEQQEFVIVDRCNDTRTPPLPHAQTKEASLDDFEIIKSSSIDTVDSTDTVFKLLLDSRQSLRKCDDCEGSFELLPSNQED